MTSKKCDYCEAHSKSNVSLSDQGWKVFLATVQSGKKKARFHKRACPLHHKDLDQDLAKFMSENSLAWKRLEEQEKLQGLEQVVNTRDPEDYVDQRGNC